MMDIKAGEEHVRSEARDWRERALKAQAEIERLRAKMERFRDQHEKDYTEIERLRAALFCIEVRGIEIISERVGGSDASYVAQELTAIAREALKHE
jgi:uncharacterized membrane protein